MDKYLDQLKQLIFAELKDEPIKMFIFGSRARGNHRLGSDVDVGFIPKGKVNLARVSFLREKLENSNIPYKVELVNFDEVSDEFKKHALEKIIIWKN